MTPVKVSYLQPNVYFRPPCFSVILYDVNSASRVPKLFLAFQVGVLTWEGFHIIFPWQPLNAPVQRADFKIQLRYYSQNHNVYPSVALYKKQQGITKVSGMHCLWTMNVFPVDVEIFFQSFSRGTVCLLGEHQNHIYLLTWPGRSSKSQSCAVV